MSRQGAARARPCGASDVWILADALARVRAAAALLPILDALPGLREWVTAEVELAQLAIDGVSHPERDRAAAAALAVWDAVRRGSLPLALGPPCALRARSPGGAGGHTFGAEEGSDP